MLDTIKGYASASWGWIKDNWIICIVILLVILIVIWLFRIFWKGIRGNE